MGIDGKSACWFILQSGSNLSSASKKDLYLLPFVCGRSTNVLIAAQNKMLDNALDVDS